MRQPAPVRRLHQLIAEVRHLHRLVGRLQRTERQLAAANAALIEENDRLQRMSAQDDLTGLLNRRGMRGVWAGWFRAGLATRVAAVAVIDLDHFKAVNDTHGHSAGDVVLRRLADLLRHNGLTGVRLGGDEFAAIVPAGMDPATAIGQLVRDMTVPIVIGHTRTIAVSMSVGVVDLAEVPEVDDPDIWLGHLMRTADFRLYAAKDSGRSRVVGPATR